MNSLWAHHQSSLSSPVSISNSIISWLFELHDLHCPLQNKMFLTSDHVPASLISGAKALKNARWWLWASESECELMLLTRAGN